MRNFDLHRFNDAAQAHYDKQKVHEFDLHRTVKWWCFAACSTIALFRYVQVFKSKHGPEPSFAQTWVGMHISADLFKSLLELRWCIQLCAGLWVKLSSDYKKNFSRIFWQSEFVIIFWNKTLSWLVLLSELAPKITGTRNHQKYGWWIEGWDLARRYLLNLSSD